MKLAVIDLTYLLDCCGVTAPRVRQAMRLFHVEGYTAEAVAGEMGISVQRARSYRSEGDASIVAGLRAGRIDYEEQVRISERSRAEVEEAFSRMKRAAALREFIRNRLSESRHGQGGIERGDAMSTVEVERLLRVRTRDLLTKT